MIELGMFFLIEDKVCGCNSCTFSSSPSSIDHICVFKFMMKLQQNKRYENQTILDLILVDGSACPLIPQLKTKVFPIVFIIKCRVVNRI